MRAMVCTGYGSPDKLQLQQRPEPEPQEHEIKIRVVAATVTAGDCEARRFDFPPFIWLPMRLFMGVFKPRKGILGQEVAGEIVAVGDKVTRFQVGDKVYAATLFRFGAYAEHICLPEGYPVSRIPSGISYEQAATIPTGGINALFFLKLAKVTAGSRVLINGAGGSIGTYALQIARQLGAQVDCSDCAEKLDTLKQLGAERVLDYRHDGVFSELGAYDAIIDVVGRKASSHQLAALKSHGRYVLGAPSLTGMVRAAWHNRKHSQKVLFDFADYHPDLLVALNQWLSAGQITPCIDRVMPMEELADAHRYVDSGKKTGNLVITVADSQQ